MENKNDFGSRLTEHLLRVCTSEGYLEGTLLSSPDFEDAWERYAPAYYGDAVREFNAYPEFSLACAGYLGMAVAFLWDKDWPRYKDVPYSFFHGPRGFDDMDDHITGTILGECELSVKAMELCGTEAYHFLIKENPEPGTAEAYRMFIAGAQALYSIGAAIQLKRLGYRFEKA